ncbi:MAG: hypothetical protein ACI37Z_05085 [Candidatus Gastranaerophilaceae bacterium]
MSIEVGSRVKVIKPGATYSRYDLWIKEFAPEYLRCWRELYSPEEIYKEDNKNNDFLVVVKAQASPSEQALCLIQAHNGFVYLVDETAIEPIAYHLQVGNIVHITNTQFVYENYKEWLTKNEVKPEIKRRWKQNTLPLRYGEYRIVKKAPKADFLPFCKTNLCLVSGPIEKTESKQNVFIVEENALFLDMF